MREKFNEYYTPKKEEFEGIWENCIFIFDTNVLLKFYKYSEKVRKNFFEIFEEISDRIWIPYQVGYEFHKNRVSKIKEPKRDYEKLIEKLEKVKNDLKDEFNRRKIHPKIDTEGLYEDLEATLEEAEKKIEEKKKKHPDLFEEDKIRKKLNKYFEGKVGDGFSQDEKEDIYTEGRKRYQEKIPPGFKDSSKELKREKFGDLLIWKEILEKADEDEKDIIFITDDRKEDWWWIDEDDKKLGPHPKLRKEIREEADVSFYMYSSEKFLEHSGDYLDITTEEEILEEIEGISEEERKERFSFALEGVKEDIPFEQVILNWFLDNFNISSIRKNFFGLDIVGRDDKSESTIGVESKFIHDALLKNININWLIREFERGLNEIDTGNIDIFYLVIGVKERNGAKRIYNQLMNFQFSNDENARVLIGYLEENQFVKLNSIP